MPDFTAIAGVSRTLKSLLLDRMEYKSAFSITIAPPDAKAERDNPAGPWLNLYLYRISENGSLKNQEIPGAGHPGAYGHPPLSLDLHYLMTAHGESNEGKHSDLNAQELLGAAMRVLHDVPIVTDRLEKTQPPKGKILDLSLQGAFEDVKITLESLSLEDLSKIWMALGDAKFRRSVGYRVSVVQIESRRWRRYPLLVGEPPEAGPKVYAAPLRSPHIREIRVVRRDDKTKKERPHLHAAIGDALILLGHGFAADSAEVRLGAEKAKITELQDRRIAVEIPDQPQLQPGPQTIEVAHPVEMGAAGKQKPHVGFRSNRAVFLLVPWIQSVKLTGSTVTVTGERLYHPDLDCLSLVGDRLVPSGRYLNPTSTTIAFKRPSGLAGGRHRVRVRVNGAENVQPREVLVP